MTTDRRESRRVVAACRFCRHSKLKCSGTHPCDRCRKRSKECIFEDRDERLAHEDRRGSTRRRAPINAEPHIQLHEEVFSSSPRPPQPPLEVTSSPQTEASLAPNFLRNRPNKRRRWLYLGASSTWTFNIRVASLIKAHLNISQDESSHSFTLDGDAYDIKLKQVNTDARPDVSRLPSLDYAIYLVNTVKFHLGDILRLYEEETFLKHLHEFYSEGPGKAGTHRLWYTQFLLLLALGKGFLNARKSPDNTSSADFFSRAMAILPNVFALHEDPILAVEVLTTISLYFYCVDMRQSAYSYIGQALRIALVEGMHVDLPTVHFGSKFAERCRKLWWTVYILERTLSSAVGAPVSVQDDHIQQPLCSPEYCSQRDATLVMHVKLCRIVSYILSEIYTVDRSLEHSYLTKTRSVLRRMAEIAKELEEIIDFKFNSSLETMSKGAVYLRLLYSQCIILATRPLLLCLLQETLRTMGVRSHASIEVPTSIRDLIQTCVESAMKTLKMLWALNDHNLLDTFLPFNLEFACSAASILILTDDILKGVHASASSKVLIRKVLDEMKAGGNKAAPLRQRELNQLRALAAQLWSTADPPTLAAPLTVSATDDDNQRESLRGNLPTGENENGNEASLTHELPSQMNLGSYTSFSLDGLPEMEPISTNSSADFAETFDFSQEQMLLLAEHLDPDAMSTMLNFGNHGLNEWF